MKRSASQSMKFMNAPMPVGFALVILLASTSMAVHIPIANYKNWQLAGDASHALSSCPDGEIVSNTSARHSFDALWRDNEDSVPIDSAESCLSRQLH